MADNASGDHHSMRSGGRRPAAARKALATPPTLSNTRFILSVDPSRPWHARYSSGAAAYMSPRDRRSCEARRSARSKMSSGIETVVFMPMVYLLLSTESHGPDTTARARHIPVVPGGRAASRHDATVRSEPPFARLPKIRLPLRSHRLSSTGTLRSFRTPLDRQPAAPVGVESRRRSTPRRDYSLATTAFNETLR